MPDFNKALLQLVDITYTIFIHSLLHNSPNLIVDGIQIWTVGRLEVRTDEVGCLPLQQLDEAKFAICRFCHFPKVRHLH